MNLHKKAFLLFLIIISLAFGWILLPFFGSIFWAIVIAIMFAPVNRRLLARFPERKNLTAVITLLLSLVMVILPATLVIGALTQELMSFFYKIRMQEIDIGAYLQQILATLPSWMSDVLERLEITDAETLREKIETGAIHGSQIIASRIIWIGQNIFEFLAGLIIMLYLLFFFLRDGKSIVDTVRRMTPFSEEQKLMLFSKFGTVIRATIKGSLVVATVQGTLGGIIFWILGIQGALLWGVIMAFLSLLPAVGSGFIWAPVAIYFLLSGSVLKGLVLIGFGVFVIGLVDNFLRPILVGKDTQMPDYVVLLSTLGGLAMFGLNGFVIGPIIAAMFIATWELFGMEQKQKGD